MGRTLCVGDVHGNHRALLQVLDRSSFDQENDRLICLGDVADGWPDVPECFETLLSIDNLVYVIGNHDVWMRDWLRFGHTPHIWTSQGGRATLDAYERIPDYNYGTVKEKHLQLLNKAHSYFIDEHNNLYVHGGFNWRQPISNQIEDDLTWDRHMLTTAVMWSNNKNDKNRTMGDYTRVFIGHTSTSRIQTDLTPVKACNVWALDQGAGWNGRLTIMDVATEQYWQSDIAKDLYPEASGR